MLPSYRSCIHAPYINYKFEYAVELAVRLSYIKRKRNNTIQEDNNAQVNQNSKNNPWIKVTQKTKKAKRPQKQSKSKKVDNNITPTNLHAEE